MQHKSKHNSFHFWILKNTGRREKASSSIRKTIALWETMACHDFLGDISFMETNILKNICINSKPTTQNNVKEW